MSTRKSCALESITVPNRSSTSSSSPDTNPSNQLASNTNPRSAEAASPSRPKVTEQDIIDKVRSVINKDIQTTIAASIAEAIKSLPLAHTTSTASTASTAPTSTTSTAATTPTVTVLPAKSTADGPPASSPGSSSSSSDASSASSGSLISELQRAINSEQVVSASSKPKSKAATTKTASSNVETENEEESEFVENSFETDERIAPTALLNVQKYGSLVSWVRLTQFKNQRNRHECEALADAIDTLLAEGVDENSLGIEKLVRRMMGVHAADTTGNWNMCDALLWNGPNNSLLSRDTLTSAMKRAATYQSLTRRLATRGGNTGYGYGQRQRSEVFRGGGSNTNVSRGNYAYRGRGNSRGGSSSSSSGTSGLTGSASSQ